METGMNLRDAGELNNAAGDSKLADKQQLARRTTKKGKATLPVKPITSVPSLPANGGGNCYDEAERRSATATNHEQAVGNCQPEASPAPADVPALVLSICEAHTARKASQRDLFALANSQRAFCRRYLGFQWDAPEKEREGVNKRAADMVASIEAGEVAADVPGWIVDQVMSSHAAKAPLMERVRNMEKVLVKLVRQLPAWERIEANPDKWRGVGEISVANIIGECGDLSKYANPAKVVKRMGLAPFNGHAPATWKSGRVGKLTAEEWTGIGYCPRRRSVLYAIGDCCIRSGGFLKAVYVAAKEREEAKHPDMSKMHRHLRAKRKMEHRLLIELWAVWNGKERELRCEINRTRASPVPAVAAA